MSPANALDRGRGRSAADRRRAHVAPFDREVFQVISARPGITSTELQKHYQGNRSKEVRAALETLLNLAPPLVIARKDERRTGRAAVRFYAADQQKQP